MKLAFIPVGSHEQHGGILPPQTDTIIAEFFAQKIATKRSGELQEAIKYGLSTEHEEFKETISLTLEDALDKFSSTFAEIINRSDINHLFVINGHGGNKSLIDLISTQNNYRNKKKIIPLDLYSSEIQDFATTTFKCFDTHAGSVEASLIAYIQGEEDRILKDPNFIKKISGGLKLFSADKIGTSGVISDIDTIEFNKSKGKKLAQRITQDLEAQVTDYLRKIELIDGKHE